MLRMRLLKNSRGATASALVAVSALSSGLGSALWKFISMAQELLLLAVVNTEYITTDLIAVYEACGFVNFNFFDPVIALLPDDIRGLSGYNVIYDNAQYHPYIFSCDNRLLRFNVSVLSSRTDIGQTVPHKHGLQHLLLPDLAAVLPGLSRPRCQVALLPQTQRLLHPRRDYLHRPGLLH